ncbi:MAG: hypothetical protein ACOYL9_14000 [Ilumatobacteraceae bacterium]
MTPTTVKPGGGTLPSTGGAPFGGLVWGILLLLSGALALVLGREPSTR